MRTERHGGRSLQDLRGRVPANSRLPINAAALPTERHSVGRVRGEAARRGGGRFTVGRARRTPLPCACGVFGRRGDRQTAMLRNDRGPADARLCGRLRRRGNGEDGPIRDERPSRRGDQRMRANVGGQRPRRSAGRRRRGRCRLRRNSDEYQRAAERRAAPQRRNDLRQVGLSSQHCRRAILECGTVRITLSHRPVVVAAFSNLDGKVLYVCAPNEPWRPAEATEISASRCCAGVTRFCQHE